MLNQKRLHTDRYLTVFLFITYLFLVLLMLCSQSLRPFRLILQTDSKETLIVTII